MSAAPRPGWYPDPAGTPDLYRWWDGGGWTEAISESPQAPSPRTQIPAAPGEDLSRRRPSRLRALVALVVCIALFLSATVGLGLMIWRDPPAVKRSGKVPVGASATPEASWSASSGAVGRLDEKTRLATVGTASMTLPGPPYRLSAEPMQVPGLLEAFFLASAPVHERYDGHQSWSAAVLLGRLSGTGAQGQDLEKRGQLAVEQLSTTFFSSHPTRLERVTVSDHAVDGHRGLRITAEVHYDVDRLPSHYDDLTAVVVGLDDGSVVAAVSSVPDDAGAYVRALAGSSLSSLEIS